MAIWAFGNFQVRLRRGVSQDQLLGPWIVHDDLVIVTSNRKGQRYFVGLQDGQSDSQDDLTVCSVWHNGHGIRRAVESHQSSNL